MNRRYSRPITDYLYRKAAANNIPIELTFELTPVCNMNCKMCYVRKSKAEQEAEGQLLNADQWKSIAKEAAELGTVYILLTGGEVFTRPDLPQILKDLNELGMVVGINTNGTLINEETIKWLTDHRPNRVNITVYGSSDETYSRLCRNPEGYTQMKHAVSLLKENDIEVRLKASITPYNVNDMKGIIDFAKSENLSLELTTYMFPPLRKDQSHIGINEGRLDAVSAARNLHSAIVHQYGKEAAKNNYLNSLKSIEERKSPAVKQKTGDKMQCQAGKTSFWITWKGDVLTCGMIPSKRNNLFEKPLSEAIESSRSEASEITLPIKCANCEIKEICKPCAAVVYTETGTYSDVPEYQCIYAHEKVKNMRSILNLEMEEKNEE